MNGNQILKVVNCGVMWLLMIASIFIGVAHASDFTSGQTTDASLEGSANGKEAVPKDSAEIIQFTDKGEQPVVFQTKTFRYRQWKKLEGPEGGYWVCPGEYRLNAGGRCRVPNSGFSGFMGEYHDAEDAPLETMLENMAGRPIALQTIEHSGDTLVVKYKLLPQPERSASVSPNDAASAMMKGFRKGMEEATKTNGTQNQNGNADLVFDTSFKALLDAFEPMSKFLGGMIIVIAIGVGISRQSLTILGAGLLIGAGTLQIPAVMRAILADAANSQDQAASPSNLFVIIRKWSWQLR